MSSILQDIDKDALIESLKEKIAELYVSSETLNQECSAAKRQVQSAQSDLRGHTATTEYYEQRHSDMADAVKSLQTELLQSKNESITFSAHMNRLSIENQRITEDLMESRRRLQSDKQMLSNNLERIEREISSNARSCLKESEDVDFLKCEIDQRLTQIEIMKTDNNNLKLQIAELEDVNTKHKTTIGEQEILSTNLQISNSKLKLENENNSIFLEEKVSEICTLKDIISKHKTTIGEQEKISNNQQMSLERIKNAMNINVAYLNDQLIKTDDSEKQRKLFEQQFYEDIDKMGKKFYHHDNEGFTMQGGRRFNLNKELQNKNRKLTEDFEEMKIALANEKKITSDYIQMLNDERNLISNLNKRIAEYEQKAEQPHIEHTELLVFNKALHNENMDYYISTIKNMRIHIEDQEKELLYMKHLNHLQLANNYKLDSQLQEQQLKSNDLQSENDTNTAILKEVNIQLESAMVENNSLTAKINNLLTIQENSMNVNAAYEQQLENMFNDKTEAQEKLNKITYNSQIKIRELMQENNELKKMIKQLSESRGEISEKQKLLQKELLEKTEILNSQSLLAEQYNEYKLHFEQSIRQLTEDLAESDKMNQSLRDINVEHLQAQYNNEQDVLMLQQHLSEQQRKIEDYKEVVAEKNDIQNRKSEFDTEEATSEVIEIVDKLKSVVNLCGKDALELDDPITESYNSSCDVNKISRNVFDKNEEIAGLILEQKELLENFHNSDLIDT